MTACRNKARGAVVAALAGALTLGAAPVMALADGASLFAVSGTGAFQDAELTGAENGKGAAVTDLENLEFVLGTGEYLVPTQVTPDGGAAVDLTKDNCKIEYFASNGQGEASGNAHDIDWVFEQGVGKYWAKVTMTGDRYNGASVLIEFSLVGKSLKGATLYNAADGNTDVTKDSFTFTGDAQTIGVALDGEALASTDYKSAVTYYDANRVKLGSAPTDAGSYYVKVDGADDYEGSSVLVPFEIDALDLATADVTIADSSKDSLGQLNVYVDGDKYDNGLFEFTYVGGAETFDENGTFTYNVAPSEAAGKNVINDVDVTFNKVDKYITAGNFKYDGNAFSAYTEGAPVVVDLEKSEKFDWSKLVVSGKGSESFKDEELTVTVTDADGNEVDKSALDATAGLYKVSVRVNAEATEYAYGSTTNSLYVRVHAGDVDSAQVYFTFDGDVMTSKNVEYDGTDLLDRLSFSVKDADGEPLDSADFYMVVTDGKSQEVTEAVDVDNYVVTLKSDKYNMVAGGNTFKLNVTAIQVSSVRFSFPTMVVRDDDKGADTKSFVPYTGSEIVPEVYYESSEKDADGNAAWKLLPADVYELSSTYSEELHGTYDDAESIKEVGYYKPSVKIAAGVENYAGTPAVASGEMFVFHVSDEKAFADVPSYEYYAQSVYTAVEQGYVEGMGGSNLFMPNKSMSRAQMVCVLYRMAGGTVQGEDWVASPNEEKYLSEFSDVNGDEFFAQALAWATKAGVVEGYEDGSFGPADDVTVEQYVTMLARYAKAVGNYEAVDADEVLATVADGDQVSLFAEDAVAWAIDNGYLAQGGADVQPQSPVSRGRAVTIAVRYQPEKLEAGVVVETPSADATK